MKRPVHARPSRPAAPGLLLAVLAGCSRETPAAAAGPVMAAEDLPQAGVVHLDRETQARLGIATAPVAPVERRPEVHCFGRVVEDPSQSFVLRAPVAGTLRASGPWPGLGATLRDGARLGTIEPRLSAAERVDLAARLAAARGEEESARAAAEQAQRTAERTRKLNAEERNVSDRALEEADTAAREASARLAAATQARSVLEGALAPVPGSSAGPVPELALERGGEVVELCARPGESVEAGAAILRVTRRGLALALLELPAGEPIDEDATWARIVPALSPERVLTGERVAETAAAEVPGRAILYRVAAEGLALRPGLPVSAWLPAPGPVETGVLVPRAAVVRHAGKAWVYLQVGEEAFRREELPLDRPLPEGWFTDAAWEEGTQLAVSGAQSLLSTELLSFPSQAEGDE